MSSASTLYQKVFEYQLQNAGKTVADAAGDLDLAPEFLSRILKSDAYKDFAERKRQELTEAKENPEEAPEDVLRLLKTVITLAARNAVKQLNDEDILHTADELKKLSTMASEALNVLQPSSAVLHGASVNGDVYVVQNPQLIEQARERARQRFIGRGTTSNGVEIVQQASEELQTGGGDSESEVVYKTPEFYTESGEKGYRSPQGGEEIRSESKGVSG